MRYLLIAAALSFGFCGTCLAQTSTPNSKTHEEPATAGNGPGGSMTTMSNQCHMEGANLVCKSPSNNQK
jgi:hypothetical protein